MKGTEMHLHAVKFFAIALLVVAFTGCGDTASTDGDSSSTNDSKANDSKANGENSDTADSGSGENGISLSPENAMITFVGRHIDKSQDDRHGGFQAVGGKLQIDDENGTPTSLMLDVETSSIYTPIGKLTDHLKGPDFFNVLEHPKMKFSSTKIEAADSEGAYTVTGDLEVLGNKGEISFPLQVTGSGDDMKLSAKFEFDRTEFGMDYGADSIEKMVGIEFQVGPKATAGE